MTGFKEFFLMNKDDVLEYVKQNTEIFNDYTNLKVSEISDGNMNYVFRVEAPEINKSIIVKQAGEHTRISKDIFVNIDRSRIEAEALLLQRELMPEYIPEVYKYDDIMHCIIMEDLKGYTIMRDALLQYNKYPGFADDISTFLVHTLISTSDIVLNHIEKKELVKKLSNPYLCDITENFVFTEPFNALSKNNDIYEPNIDFITKEIFNDEKLKLEVAKLKFQFMNNPQALIHGDLHTGSIFIKEDSVIIFDPEFAFFGPMGFDLGNVAANLLFAWIHAEALFDGEDSLDYLSWLESAISETIDLFAKKFREEFKKRVTESMAKLMGFSEFYLDSILKDTASFAGIEMIRRIVGIAHVKDITSIDSIEKRIRAERIIIKLSKYLIFNSHSIKKGKDYITLLKKFTEN
ncbi:MAG: S-methyl-5-thioribose kinase [Clostridiaceae bacterium]